MLKRFIVQVAVAVAGWLLPSLTRELRGMAKSIASEFGVRVLQDREARQRAVDALIAEAEERGLRVTENAVQEALAIAIEALEAAEKR